MAPAHIFSRGLLRVCEAFPKPGVHFASLGYDAGFAACQRVSKRYGYIFHLVIPFAVQLHVVRLAHAIPFALASGMDGTDPKPFIHARSGAPGALWRIMPAGRALVKPEKKIQLPCIFFLRHVALRTIFTLSKRRRERH